MPTIAELKYLLTLDPKQFTGTLSKAKKQFEDTRKSSEKPIKFRSEGGKQIISTLKNMAAAYLSFQAVVGSVRVFREFETGIA
jgi:hypothetical protein